MADEYISRKDAMEYLFRAINADPDGNCPDCVHDEHECQYDRCWTLMDFCEKIEYLGYVPAADVAPVRHGRWIDTYGDSWICSACGAELYLDEDWRKTDERSYQMNYCHYCGAKMDGEA